MDVTTFLFFSFLVESLVEYIFAEWAGRWIKYIALGVGVLLSLVYQIDIVELLSGLHVPIVGNILTGFIIGRGSNFINDITDYLRMRAN